jgi:hypothetical protein
MYTILGYLLIAAMILIGESVWLVDRLYPLPYVSFSDG